MLMNRGAPPIFLLLEYHLVSIRNREQILPSQDIVIPTLLEKADHSYTILNGTTKDLLPAS